MSELRIAFVGCGGIAARYLGVYRESDAVRVVACIDANLDEAKRAADAVNHGMEVTAMATSDFAVALGGNVDAVIINTPNHLHRSQAIAALEAGKHVLLQKPIAPTFHESEEVAEAAARAGGTSGLYMSYFDQPLMYDLRGMIRANWFGRVVHLYARLMHRWGIIWSQQSLNGDPSWRDSVRLTGGGCFIQLAVHYIHLFSWMTNERVVRATAVMRNLACPGLEGEDIAAVILELESGTMATLDMAWCTAGEQLSVHGTNGTCEYIGNRMLLLASDAGTFDGRVVRYTKSDSSFLDSSSGAEQMLEIVPPAMGDFRNSFNQHRAFLEALRDGRPAPVSIASGVEDMRVVAAVYESAHTGRTVTIERSANHPHENVARTPKL